MRAVPVVRTMSQPTGAGVEPCVCGCPIEAHSPECEQCDCIHYEADDPDWADRIKEAVRVSLSDDDLAHEHWGVGPGLIGPERDAS